MAYHKKKVLKKERTGRLYSKLTPPPTTALVPSADVCMSAEVCKYIPADYRAASFLRL